jgi:site-specific recombinase XerD
MAKGIYGQGRVYQTSYKYKGVLKKSKNWHIEYWDKGERHREPVNSTKKSDAQAKLKERIGQAGTGELLPSDIAATIYEDLKRLIIDDYTANGHVLKPLNDALKRLDTTFAGMKASDISTPRWTAYQAEAITQGYSNASVNRDRAALNRMLRLGHRARKVRDIPVLPGLQERNARKGFFERAEFDKICEHLPPALVPLFKTAFVTGWRVADELLTRQWQHVNFALATLRLEPDESKNREAREFPFTAELRKILEGQRDAAKKLTDAGTTVTHVFFWPDGSRIYDGSKYHDAWRDAVKASGVQRIPHDFRRTAVRNLVRAGIPERVAMKLTGHKTRAVFDRYNIVSETDLRDAAAKLDTFQQAETKHHRKAATNRGKRSAHKRTKKSVPAGA